MNRNYNFVAFIEIYKLIINDSFPGDFDIVSSNRSIRFLLPTMLSKVAIKHTPAWVCVRARQLSSHRKKYSIEV